MYLCILIVVLYWKKIYRHNVLVRHCCVHYFCPPLYKADPDYRLMFTHLNRHELVFSDYFVPQEINLYWVYTFWPWVFCLLNSFHPLCNAHLDSSNIFTAEFGLEDVWKDDVLKGHFSIITLVNKSHKIPIVKLIIFAEDGNRHLRLHVCRYETFIERETQNLWSTSLLDLDLSLWTCVLWHRRRVDNKGELIALFLSFHVEVLLCKRGYISLHVIWGAVK